MCISVEIKQIGDSEMIKLTVKVTSDCEGLISNLPSGYGYELYSESYTTKGGTVNILIHDQNLTDLTSGMEQVLNNHPGVVSYDAVHIS
jgi:hypothetical protein